MQLRSAGFSSEWCLFDSSILHTCMTRIPLTSFCSFKDFPGSWKKSKFTTINWCRSSMLIHNFLYKNGLIQLNLTVNYLSWSLLSEYSNSCGSLNADHLNLRLRIFWCCISSVKREFLLTRSHNAFWWNRGSMSIQKCLKLQSVMISSAYLSKCHNKAVMLLLGMKFHQLGKSIGKMIEHDIITRIFTAPINWHVKWWSHLLDFKLCFSLFFHITLSKESKRDVNTTYWYV